MIRKIVSYAFFRSTTSVYEKEKGDASLQFSQFLAMLVRAHYCIWRGYEFRLHHDDHVTTNEYWPALRKMTDMGLLTLKYCGPSKALCTSMLWRMKPVFEGDDQIVVCRDVDSVPMLRDRLCVEEWLRSGLTVNAIHDNAAHSGVMGGTTSVRSKRFKELLAVDSMDAFLALGEDFDWTKQGADQHLLNRLLPRFATETLVHELHHRVNDMGAVRVRDTVVAPGFVFDGPDKALSFSDGLCSTVGGCTDPKAAFDFYDTCEFPELEIIRRCEA